MVLKRILPNVKDQRGKWAPNYEGPYVVKQDFSGGALILTNAERRDLKYPVNANSARKARFQKQLGRRQPLKQGQVVSTSTKLMAHGGPPKRINP
ncbi:hypothetical protein CR513_17794, partial [Mucuna pruriens]